MESEHPSGPSEHPEAQRLCDLLADEIQANTGERPTIGKRWLDAARLLLTRDGYTVEQVEYLIRWSQADEFWRSNILSMSKLREKRLTLITRAKERSARRRAPGPAASANDFHAYETSGRVAL